MKLHVLTLFPEMILQGLAPSIIGRAVEKKIISLDAVNIRDYTLDKHGKVDDYTYGGGAGMLMQAQPVYDAWKAASGGKKIRTDTSADEEIFHTDLLEYPQYSRPESWHEKRVPEVLLSGNHAKIMKWRLEQSEARPLRFRPDLYEQ